MSTRDKLRSALAHVHDQSEGQEFQGQLGSGVLPLPLYKQFLGQFLKVHGHFALLRMQYEQQASGLDRLAPYEEKLVECLTKDLTHLGVDKAKISSLTSTEQFNSKISALCQRHPYGLVGAYYVLLGSKHGGSMIAQTCKQVYGFKDAGYLYFAPFGNQLKENWSEFVDVVNSLSVDDDVFAVILDAASETFQYHDHLGTELLKSSDVSSTATAFPEPRK